jgi:DNA-binding MarR family transcriptional regulator
MTATLGLTEEQFRTTLSLYGSIMPDGRALRGDVRTNRPTFDDWLNELEDRGLREE